MTSKGAEETFCVDCPACVSAATKDREVAEGTRCSVCYSPIESWDSRARDGLCGNHATAQPAAGLGAVYGRGRQ